MVAIFSLFVDPERQTNICIRQQLFPYPYFFYLHGNPMLVVVILQGKHWMESMWVQEHLQKQVAGAATGRAVMDGVCIS